VPILVFFYTTIIERRKRSNNMDEELYESFSKFFNKVASVEAGIKELVTKSCNVEPGTSVEDILNGVRDVVDELDSYFTTKPATSE